MNKADNFIFSQTELLVSHSPTKLNTAGSTEEQDGFESLVQQLRNRITMELDQQEFEIQQHDYKLRMPFRSEQRKPGSTQKTWL